MLTFQEIISRLTAFWEEKGCIVHQGYDLEVGAGTFNPATFLRALGPEPYSTVYTEPSRRPKDGRYGDNPNRMQLFHQLQVVIKPSPLNIQSLYLDSLRAIGLKLEEHDIRFVHDDWEGPTLGAWGLGWEVWCDGMEVTQFTYLQAVGSLPLHPIPVELTYGLERIALFIQNVDSLFDVRWNEALTLRDLIHQGEVQWSSYNFAAASIEMWRRHFDDFEQEAKALIALDLPLPAYDFVMKASHAFNILDARGAISVTERTGYVGRIRDLARLIALAYLGSRERLGFPLLKQNPSPSPSSPRAIDWRFAPSKKRDFLLEIGSEQLPATFVPIGCRLLEHAMRSLLKAQELPFEALSVYGTPHRLALFVKGLAEGSCDKTIDRRGPALASAFDEAGALTPQGAGFFTSIGAAAVTRSALESGEVEGLEVRAGYLFAQLSKPGRATAEILSEALPKLILALEFPKKMRWANLDISYARPLQWIVALFGGEVIPFEVGPLRSGRDSEGHAQLRPGQIALPSADAYLEVLRSAFVIADVEERKQSILKQLGQIEEDLGGRALQRDRVLAQVLYLTEWPQLTHTSFSREFLRVPPEVLVAEMVEHQKYFPLVDPEGKLMASFVITADNTPNALIRRGNQKVLSARLTDGLFLYEQELKTPLESLNEKLKLMTFQKELGSMHDKMERVRALAEKLNALLGRGDKERVSRAALLCKADLASGLVGEFPELQGTVGKYYALAQNEDPEVAAAIEEHWMPRGEGAPLPSTATGVLLGLADKIDNLNAYYSVGLKPTSSSDPYALRRQALGVIRTLIEQQLLLDLSTLLDEEPLYFLTSRAKSHFEEEGFRKDEVEATLQGLCNNPYDQYRIIQALHQFRAQGDAFGKLLEVYKRAKGHVRGHDKERKGEQRAEKSDTPFDPLLAQEPAERALIKQLSLLDKRWHGLLEERRYEEAFAQIASLHAPLANLFDTVKILAEDPVQRSNRIALLERIFSLLEQLLDFSKIQNS